MAEIDPEIASLVLVGRFLKQICGLEEKLNEAIAGALNIDDPKRFILCANIQFRNKIHILRLFVNTSNLPEQDKAQFNDELTKIGNLYEKRNTLSHQYFKTAPNGDGVVFLIVHTKGGAAPLETPWTKTDFDEKGKIADNLMATAVRLKSALTDGTFVLQRHNPNWINWFGQADIPLPMQHTMSPALHDHLSRPTQSPLDSDRHPTSPQNRRQIKPMKWLARIFTWWHGQTLNTALHTLLFGKFVGKDECGNRYYRTRKIDKALGFERRWVIYAGESDGSMTPQGWYGWLHHTFDVPPTPLETPWTKTDFDEKGKIADNLMATAVRLKSALTDGTFVLQRHNPNWINWFGQADIPLPMQHTMSPALHDHLSRPTQSPLDSDRHPTSPQNRRQIKPMKWLARIFTWWHGQTLNTALHTLLFGKFVGKDECGNRYYRTRKIDKALGFERRWVIYAGESDGSMTPQGWYGWLHHTFDVPPTQEEYAPRTWELPHQPNLTGTPQAWRPPGSTLAANARPPATGDYEAWTPEG